MPKQVARTDAGLSRLARTTRVVLATSVAATAVIFGIAAKSSSGSSTKTSLASGGTTGSTAATSGSSDGSVSEETLPPILPPVQGVLPAPSQTQSSVTSGGS